MTDRGDHYEQPFDTAPVIDLIMNMPVWAGWVLFGLLGLAGLAALWWQSTGNEEE